MSMNHAKKMWALAIAICLGVFVPQTASASDLSREELETFEQHIRQSGDYLNDDEFGQAIDELRKAREIIDHPRIAIRMGQAYDEWGRCLDAEETFQDVLGRDDVSDEDQEGVRQLLDELGECVEPGRMHVECVPESTTVEMSGGDLEGPRIMNCPIAEDVSAGEYRLQGRADGYRDATISVQVREGEEIRAQLRLSEDVEPEEEPSVAELDTPSGDEAPEEGRHRLNHVGWASMGAGALMIAGGGLMDLRSSGRRDDLLDARDEGDVERVESLQSSASRSRGLTLGFYGVGAALLGTGVALTIIDFGEEEGGEGHARRATIELGPGHISTRLRW